MVGGSSAHFDGAQTSLGAPCSAAFAPGQEQTMVRLQVLPSPLDFWVLPQKTPHCLLLEWTLQSKCHLILCSAI